MEQWDRFRAILGNIAVRALVPDTIGWNLCPNGVFLVKSFKRSLEGEQMGVLANMSDIWKVCCPHKVEIFMWQLLHGGVMVREALRKRGILVGSDLQCLLCTGNEETVDHLFFHCRWA